MNTLNYHIPILKPGDYVIVNDDLEFAFSKEQLQHITDLHNEGLTLEEISLTVKRDIWEVLQAIIHQVRKGRKMKPIAYRK